MEHDIWFNGKFAPFEDVKIHLLSHVTHYGSRVLEGIRSFGTETQGPAIFRLSEHLRRIIVA